MNCCALFANCASKLIDISAQIGENDKQLPSDMFTSAALLSETNCLLEQHITFSLYETGVLFGREIPVRERKKVKLKNRHEHSLTIDEFICQKNKKFRAMSLF